MRAAGAYAHQLDRRAALAAEAALLPVRATAVVAGAVAAAGPLKPIKKSIELTNLVYFLLFNHKIRGF